MRTAEIINLIESFALRSQLGERETLLLQIEALQHGRGEAQEKAAYWERQVLQADKDIKKLHKQLKAGE